MDPTNNPSAGSEASGLGENQASTCQYKRPMMELPDDLDPSKRLRKSMPLQTLVGDSLGAQPMTHEEKLRLMTAIKSLSGENIIFIYLFIHSLIHSHLIYNWLLYDKCCTF